MLRKKTMQLVGLAALVMGLAFFVLSELVLIKSFLDLEKDDLTANVRRVVNELSGQMVTLDANLQQWAYWTDAHRWAGGEQPDFKDENLIDENFETMRMDYMVVVTAEGEVLYSEGRDHLDLTPLKVPDWFHKELQPGGLLNPPEFEKKAQAKVSGLVEVDGGLMLVVSRNILANQKVFPRNGVMVLGIRLSKTVIEDIYKKTELRFGFLKPSEAKVPPGTKGHKIGEKIVPEISFSSTGEVHGRTPLQQLDGSLAAVLEVRQAREIYSRGRASVTSLLVFVVFFLVVMGVVLVLFLDKQVVAPVVETSRTLGAMASGKGDLTRQVMVRQNDEVGQMATHLNQMMGNLRSIVVEVKHLAEKVEKTAESTTQLAEGAEANARQAADKLDTLVEGVQNQFKAVESVDKAVLANVTAMTAVVFSSQQVLGSAKEASTSVKEGSHSADEAKSNMELLENHAKDANRAVLDLFEQASKIEHSVAAIGGVAEQTNLLALNAAIEAARAGEGGKGFAVVADEVRKLAQDSAVAAREISALLKNIQTGTVKTRDHMEDQLILVHHGVGAMEKAVNSFDVIEGLVADIADQVAAINDASAKMEVQNQSVVQGVRAVESVSAQTVEASSQARTLADQQADRMAEVMGECRELLKESVALNDLMDQFKV